MLIYSLRAKSSKYIIRSWNDLELLPTPLQDLARYFAASGPAFIPVPKFYRIGFQ